MAGLGAKDILRNITALEQLIEEINFQRAKEMRQCLMSKDSDSSFVIVQGTTYWTDLFVRHFLFQTDRSTDADDLLFFIRKKHIKGSRYVPRYQTEVEVYRKDSRKLPIGDPDVDWEETVYLNLIIHQFEYTLTLAVCTRTSPKELQVLRRHSQKVYASPSRRRMDTKGEVEEITYPNVCFHVDNFDEVFADMLVRDGEMVCVELVAADYSGSRQAVIFLGSIRYEALKRVFDARASLSSKVAQRMMLGLFSSGGGAQRIEFVRMKGPQGKGHAEMAVTKPKGSGVETPSSEPGVSLTDLWDPDWEDEPEDRFFYAHQRRLSDPSANFNTFINSGWKTRSDGVRSRSENEGLDNFADGLYEIESGDVRDAVCSGKCCSVPCRKVTEDDVCTEPVCMKCKQLHKSSNDDFELICLQPSSSKPDPLEDSPLLMDVEPGTSNANTEDPFGDIVDDVMKENVNKECEISSLRILSDKIPGKAVRVCSKDSVKRNTFPLTSSEKKLVIAESVLRKTKENPIKYKVMQIPPNRLKSDQPNQMKEIRVPYRTTKDGTKVYFICGSQLDDGSYNPLWTTKGFTQTFHFWKENKRQQSVPLNAYLTYVTLPWFTIITDILDHRTGPILTF